MRPFRRSRGPEPEQGSEHPAAHDWRLDAELDAYLGGVYVEWMVQHGRAIPSWAWINPIAHATIDELDARATQRADSRRSAVDLWWRVVAFLAGQVLARTGRDPAALEDLQRRVLVPLELHAASNHSMPSSPGDLGTIVLRVLESDHRSHP